MVIVKDRNDVFFRRHVREVTNHDRTMTANDEGFEYAVRLCEMKPGESTVIVVLVFFVVLQESNVQFVIFPVGG